MSANEQSHINLIENSQSGTYFCCMIAFHYVKKSSKQTVVHIRIKAFENVRSTTRD